MHNGLKLAGVSDLNSIGEHALRAAQIGYILTVLENEKHNTNLSPERVASILIFHDNGEIRIGDLHKIATRYIDSKEAEKNAFVEQAGQLPKKIKQQIIKYFEEIEERNTKEGIIAKDADWLENAFMAKEQHDLGNQLAKEWVDNVGRAIETESAKEVFKIMKETKFTDWWMSIKKFMAKKLDGTEVIHGENNK